MVTRDAPRRTDLHQTRRRSAIPPLVSITQTLAPSAAANVTDPFVCQTTAAGSAAIIAEAAITTMIGSSKE